MGRRRVPERDADFNSYIKNTAAVLESGSPTGAVRLGLSADEKNKWLAFRDAWIIIYAKYSDVSKRTKTIKEDKNKLKEDFTRFAAMPLNKIAGSGNITNEDRATFRLPVGGSVRTRRGSMQGDTPFGGLHSMGGLRIKVRARLDESVGRCRMHPMADVLEMKYMFVDVQLNFLKPRLTASDCPHSMHSTKALFTMDAGQENLGKRMLAFMRWVNFINPSHNSGWSMVMNVVVG